LEAPYRHYSSVGGSINQRHQQKIQPYIDILEIMVVSIAFR